jgi:hypothetical protein
MKLQKHEGRIYYYYGLVHVAEVSLNYISFYFAGQFWALPGPTILRSKILDCLQINPSNLGRKPEARQSFLLGSMEDGN